MANFNDEADCSTSERSTAGSFVVTEVAWHRRYEVQYRTPGRARCGV
jgi:hypothetical protein